MSHIVIGMAGHIDHGKTALIRALTGIETDQLPQEKERGITIDLGFAYWKDNVTIIDVPGHEKFIHNMVAGVSTVNTFLLVIAADDGVMPQTREHLEILRFFGVKNGLVALNKIDLVDEEWLELVQLEVHDFLADSGYPGLPVFPVSAEKGQGIEKLREALEANINQIKQIRPDRPFRLCVDRSFFMKGYGNVVTGTVLSDRLNVNEQLVALPENLPLRVRGLQVHQHGVDSAFSGQRVAINITGNSKAILKRGQVIVKPDSLISCKELFAEIQTTSLFNSRIKRLAEVRVHLGTSERKARLNWFEAENALQAQKIYHVHLKFKEAAVVAPGDVILLRSFSPAVTIGGGSVLEIEPPHLRRKAEHWQTYFNTLKSASPGDRILFIFRNGGYRTFSVAQISALLFEHKKNLVSYMEQFKKKKILTDIPGDAETYFLLTEQADKFITGLLDRFKSRQAKEKEIGLNVREMKELAAPFAPDERFFQFSLKRAVNKKHFFYDGRHYSGSINKDVVFEKDNLRQKILQAYQNGEFVPPDSAALAKDLGLSASQMAKISQQLLSERLLLSISGNYYLHHLVFESLVKYLKGYFKKKPSVEISEIRNFTRSSRKFLIPLMEFLDQEGLTVRDGDIRRPGRNL